MSDTSNQVAALVILYHYSQINIEFISSYADQVGRVYCFDNSENENPELERELLKIENLTYISYHQNMGLPKAINIVSHKAMEEGYKWLTTFDQDSQVDKMMIPTMRDFISNFDKIEDVGIVAPVIEDGKTQFGIPVSEFSYYDRVIQSGAMHNLEILHKLDGYDENLFIDQVDFEYCIRLIKNQYKIVKLNKAILIHNIEDKESEVKYINGKRYLLNKYPPIRYYYIIRNNLYCGKKYRDVFRPYYAETRRNMEVIRKTVWYDKDKLIRIKAIICAYIDYACNRMGQCKWKL